MDQHISVIIPCYNSAAYIDRAVGSALNQTLLPTELILVDNGSTDDTWAKLESYRDKHPELVKIFRETKKGAPAARNKGLREATGTWVQFLDSDDELLPDKLSEQCSIACRTGADVVAGSCFIYHWDKENVTKHTHTVQFEDIWLGLANSRLGRTSSNLFRRQSINAVGGWDEKLRSSQEYNLLFRILQQGGKLECCRAPMAIIHVQENSVHKSSDIKRSLEISDAYLDLRLRIKQYLGEKGLLTPARKREIETHMYGCLMNLQRHAPEYVRTKTEELNLRLSPVLKLRRQLRKFRHQLSHSVRQLIKKDRTYAPPLTGR